ncbi:MAG TPA: pseudouridine synthase [Dehalococcoidia bacterium]|nr:pseudouridine synthase [Dehalococcoidia bacterium]
MRERLQKILARAGHGSRRSAEALIAAGRVSVNGVTVTAPGSQADPDVDSIELDGRPLRIEQAHVYLVMNKPAGVVTTLRDPQRRRTVMDLLPPSLPPHVFPVGRLDRDTEGLLLFTDDGGLAHRLTHPRYRIDKEYCAEVLGAPGPVALANLRRGVVIDDRRTAPATIELAQPPHGHIAHEGHTWLRLVIHEGRKRQVRLMCAAVGHPVRALVRTRIGDVLLARLLAGKTRPLAVRELAELRRLVGLPPAGS